MDNEPDRRVLERLLNHQYRAYWASADDRQRLHDIEWQTDTEAPALLGEVESRASMIGPIVVAALRPVSRQRAVQVDVLRSNSLLRSGLVKAWIAEHGEDFPSYLAYLAATEALRSATLDFLEAQGRDDPDSGPTDE